MSVKHTRVSPSQLAYLTIVAVVVAVLFVAYLWHNWGYAVDDSYITFRYAQNALLGHGFVFNVGERFYGSTATGYAVILAGVAAMGRLLGFGWEVPDISTCLSGAGIAVIALTVAACVKQAANDTKNKNILICIVPVVFSIVLLFVLPLSNLVSGHETYFYVSLVVLATYVAVFASRMYLATAILIVATTCRPDVALLALLLYVVIASRLLIGRSDIRSIARKLCPPGIFYLIGLLIWCAWTKMYYGAFLPETLGAKEAQIKLGVFPVFNFTNLHSYLTTQFDGSYWVTLVAIVIACFVITAVSRLSNRATVTDGNHKGQIDVAVFSASLFLYGLCLAIAYICLGVSIWWWYISPIGIFILVAGFCAVAYALFIHVGEHLATGRLIFLQGIVTGLCIMVVCAIASPFLASSKTFFQSRQVNPHLASYNYFLSYLRAENPQGATIATSEPGTMAYRLGPKFRVMDVLGLVTPGVVDAILHGDFNYVVPHLKPKYVIVSWQGLYQPDGYPGFNDLYQFVGEFDAPYWEASIKHGAYLFKRYDQESMFERANVISVSNVPEKFVRVASLPQITPEDGALCNLAKLSGVNLLSGVPAVLSQATRVTISGWAASTKHLPVGSIFVRLASKSGQFYTARAKHRVDDYGTAAYLHWNGEHFPSGFTGVFDFSEVPSGIYSMDLLFLQGDKLIECSNGRMVNVSSGSATHH